MRELIALGTHFALRGDPEAREYDLGREGGHSDAASCTPPIRPGSEIMRALGEAVRATPGSSMLENHLAVDLLVDARASAGRPSCWGAYVLDREQRRGATRFLARATVLATGGAGKVYLYTTNPDVATGDGVAMAYRAGAADRQHGVLSSSTRPASTTRRPSRSSSPRRCAARARVLRRPDGTPFMERYHADAELAPRDVVARAIDFEMKGHGAECVLPRHHPPAAATSCASASRTSTQSCLQLRHRHHRAADPGRAGRALHAAAAWSPTCDGAHHHPRPLRRRRGARCTGLHGANRLASNSLLEGAGLRPPRRGRRRVALARATAPRLARRARLGRRQRRPTATRPSSSPRTGTRSAA